MMGSFLSRGLIMVFGYAYPAYECFKVVDKNKPETEQLLFWCQYWILVAMLTVCERVGDNLISWLPMYSETKLAFFVYLWYPKAKGTVYVYNSFFQPFVAKHETKIDRNLLELKDKAWGIALFSWHKAATYGRKKFFEILPHVSSQLASQPHSDQQEPNAKNVEPCASNSISQATKEKQSKGPKTSSCASLSQRTHEPASKLEKIPIEPVSWLENGNLDFSQQETISKESMQVTRGRWRLFRSAAKH